MQNTIWDKIKNYLREKKSLFAIIAIIVVLFVIVATIFINLNKKNSLKDITLIYYLDDKANIISDNSIVNLYCQDINQVSVNNVSQLAGVSVNWTLSEVSENNIISLTASENCCFLQSEAPGECIVTATGKGIRPVSFTAVFERREYDLEFANTAWTAGNINYYFFEDGTVYIIYEDENNYIKGNYSITKVNSPKLSKDTTNSFNEIVAGGAIYQVDIAVTSEYLSGSVFNNDGYSIYICGNQDKIAIFDSGWGFTKEAEPIAFLSQAKFDEIFGEQEEKANKKISKKKLGEIANTAWNCDGVNYYFYDDGVFEAVSIVNHDFIRGTYTCNEFKPADIDEDMVARFSAFFMPKKYYLVNCNVEKEIYKGENVSVTSLTLLIGRAGNLFAMYDSNWDQVSSITKIAMEARDDFDIFFDRNKTDINDLFKENAFECNGVRYYFCQDGTFYSCNDKNNIYIKGKYIATDVYDDLMPKELIAQIKNDLYYYAEIKIEKTWHPHKSKDNNSNYSKGNEYTCIYLIITESNKGKEVDDMKSKRDIRIYDEYYGTYDKAMEIDMQEIQE